MKSRFAVIVLPLVLTLVGGCGDGTKKPNASVTGAVTFNGQPVTNGSVNFSPEDGKGDSAEAASDLNQLRAVLRTRLDTFGRHLQEFRQREDEQLEQRVGDPHDTEAHAQQRDAPGSGRGGGGNGTHRTEMEVDDEANVGLP